MKVFKFGGASVNSVERIKNIPLIINQFPGEQLMIIISAMGKTTNALEKVATAFYEGRKDDALLLFGQVKQQHLTTAKYVLVTHYLACAEQLSNFFTEVEWLLYDQPVREFDYYYDQIVCVGELLSTSIISAYLNETGIRNTWVDVRDVLRTDDNFRDAIVNQEQTLQHVKDIIIPQLHTTGIVLTQGFIGATDENESTTLGREGSDYTGAIFANMLDAESLTIWKDVEGVMNADPKHFLDAKVISELNYTEVIEMAYYGAQVIHPKTIKPLQNKLIPLYAKCFLDPSLPGTVIKKQVLKDLPPIIVLKEDQVLIQMKSKDFSFVEGEPLTTLYRLFQQLNIKPNLTQNGAITFLCVLDNRQDKIEKLALEASAIFEVQVIKGMQLLTIRHYNRDIFEKLVGSKKILLRQQTTATIQVLTTNP
ncbi:MAG: aspartate kinase [Terrimonas sp.]|nr:aspartate kinase [Terrimonas sp.]